MKKIRNGRKYDNLSVNDVIFEDIQVFIQGNYIELVNNLGNIIAFVYKNDIQVVEID